MYIELAIAIELECTHMNEKVRVQKLLRDIRAMGRFDGFTEGVLTTMALLTAYLTIASIMGVV